MPPGFFFDPYFGDGLGCLRAVNAHGKIMDEITEQAAIAYAHALVKPLCDFYEKGK